MKKTQKTHAVPKKKAQKIKKQEKSVDRVEEASIESFPASDAPAWISSNPTGPKKKK